MWQRFTLYDLRIIGHYLGMLILFSALLMAVPLITALVFQEWEPAVRYLFSIGIALFFGSILRFCHIEPGRLNARQALAVVGLAWIVLGLFCSIPLYFSGHFLNYLDAVFDGVSGLTTTGASLIQDLDHLSYADNMFRFMMHLLGGLGLIVVALSLGIFGKKAGSSLFKSEGRNESVVPNVINTTRFIAKFTAIAIVISTLIIGAIMFISGIEPARAFLQSLWVAISGFVTGGFTPMQQSIMYYHSFVMEFFLMILMLMGAVSFVIYARAGKGRAISFFKDIETKTTFIWLAVLVAVFTASLSASNLYSDLFTLMRRGMFMVISAFTTTGFSVMTVNQILSVLTSGAFLAIAITMAVGGGAGSTAGGIKVYRVGIIAKSVVSTIKEAVSPDSARVVVSYYHNGRRILTPDVVKEAMTIFILYVVTYSIGALVGIAHGYDAIQSVFESVAMTSNGGIIIGIASPGMPVTLELFYILQMWAGRLEFITLLALIAQIVAGILPRKGDRFIKNDKNRAERETNRKRRETERRSSSLTKSRPFNDTSDKSGSRRTADILNRYKQRHGQSLEQEKSDESKEAKPSAKKPNAKSGKAEASLTKTLSTTLLVLLVSGCMVLNGCAANTVASNVAASSASVSTESNAESGDSPNQADSEISTDTVDDQASSDSEIAGNEETDESLFEQETVQSVSSAPVEPAESSSDDMPSDTSDDTNDDPASLEEGASETLPTDTAADTLIEPPVSVISINDPDAEDMEGEGPDIIDAPLQPDMEEQIKKKETSVPVDDIRNKINPSQLPDSSFIYDASISDLENADSYLNGQTVQVVGEVVGDRIINESNNSQCWITLEATDGSFAEISVLMPLSTSSIIDTYGKYGKIGTRLQVRGIFNLACPEHQGLSDLHAENVSLVAQGMTAKTPVNIFFLTWGFMLCIASVVCTFVFIRLRERER